MSKPPRDLHTSSSNTYFVTANAFQQQSLFQSERNASLLVSTLFSYRDQGKFLIHEFAIMPNHVHLLLTLGERVTLERAIQFAKGGFSFRAGRELGIATEIWQRGYTDHRIRDERDFASHREYIRMNPVKACLSETPEQYPYCSASTNVRLDAVPQGLKPGLNRP